MGSESTSPRCQQYGNFYKYFIDKPSPEATVSGSVISDSESSTSSIKSPTQSMLVTGFGLRNVESLQRALLDDEQRRQMLLAQYDKEESLECESLKSLTISKDESVKTETKDMTVVSNESQISKRKDFTLEYLMGLGQQVGEEAEPLKTKKGPKAQPLKEQLQEDLDLSVAMMKAQQYLREHKIGEFFQFLIAHMLSALPDNPIEFLLDLLDKCLLYRSGFGQPPLLYQKPHIEQLFHLMDRMRTGFIELEQYKTGMKTLGICSSYDSHPPLSTDGMVSKEFFIEEAYECLVDLFVEMIRSHGPLAPPSSQMTPPPTMADLCLEQLDQ